LTAGINKKVNQEQATIDKGELPTQLKAQMTGT
jgi:hypothetical protein